MTGLTQGMIESCNTEFARRASFRMRDDHLRTFIESNPDLLSMLLETYPEANGRGLDTYDRDLLFDTFAIEVIGMKDGWPMNGSEKAYSDQFLAILIAKIQGGEFIYADA